MTDPIYDLEQQLPSLTPEEAARLLGELARLGALVNARLAGRREEEDRLLDVREAAAVLGCKPDWIYRRAEDLPFAVRLGPGQLRFSSRGIQKWIRLRQK